MAKSASQEVEFRYGGPNLPAESSAITKKVKPPSET
jgi:hypothetical protein